MYVRFVRLRLREGAGQDFQDFYEQRVIPALEATEGCLFAGLLRPWRGGEYKSLTIWRSDEDAAAYEKSGLYARLLRAAEPLLSKSTVWRVRLTEDPEETADATQREIPPEGYRVEDPEPPPVLAGASPSLYLRIVSMRVAPGRLDDFVRLYRENVIPALEQVDGCQGIFLAEGVGDGNDVLSITLWDREESAVRYEMSGEFDRLVRNLQDTFSPLYQWRMSLDPQLGADAGEAVPDVEGYHLVAGRSL